MLGRCDGGVVVEGFSGSRERALRLCQDLSETFRGLHLLASAAAAEVRIPFPLLVEGTTASEKPLMCLE